ncbi:hypothetical protein [Micromonospora sp. CPCC 206061]|uniref:hypothetical protein n=1 Tax=Micromonospora sp. CPCC 206061 TaxID=3122410 RepID=UPI002FF150F0
MIILGRFNGPPGSGNGGYSAGVFAAGLPVEVTLRRPPPLDTPLTTADDEVRTPDGTVVATLAPADPITVAVPPVSPAEAVTAAATYQGFTDHPFPSCYVCGPEHPDGLHIFPGQLPGDRTAAPWTVPPEVTVPTVWAALDCPGGWAIIGPGRPYVLGRIAAQVRTLPVPDEQCVVVGALAAAEGRKALVHTALYGPDGAELARARATWIAVTV